MLVDMAGSENIEQAGQTGFEAKMQVHCQKERKKKIRPCFILVVYLIV